MRKLSRLLPISLIVLIGGFGLSMVKADTIEPNTRRIEKCVVVSNPDKFSDYNLVGYISGPIKSDNYIIQKDKCLAKGYKFNSLTILLVKKAYLNNVGLQNISVKNENVINLGNIEPFGDLVDDDNPWITQDQTYLLLQNCGNYSISMIKEVSSYNNGSPDKTVQIDPVINQCPAFSDVKQNNPSFEAIEYMKSNNVIKGYSDGTFKPNSTINRAEFIKIIIESSVDQDEIDSCIDDNIASKRTYVYFPDVKKTDWFAKYICVAKSKGIISGYPDGKFKPNNTIKFVEAAKIIVNTFGYDTVQSSVWYKPFVEVLGGKSAIPTSISWFNQNINRGETAEIIWRLEEHIYNKTFQKYEDLK